MAMIDGDGCRASDKRSPVGEGQKPSGLSQVLIAEYMSGSVEAKWLSYCTPSSQNPCSVDRGCAPMLMVPRMKTRCDRREPRQRCDETRRGVDRRRLHLPYPGSPPCSLTVPDSGVDILTRR